MPNRLWHDTRVSGITLKRLPQPFHRFDARSVSQGRVAAGETPMVTLLGSCVCIGFYHAGRRLGAISHITGFDHGGAHQPEDALDALEAELRRTGLAAADCECFVVGGCDTQRHVYDASIAALARRNIRFAALDVLGNWHRKLAFDPRTGEACLYKSPLLHKRAGAAEGHPRFQDPRARLATGATVFFRNDVFLDFLRRQALPALLQTRDRLHVWCAGCSIGMEVYSFAMVALDWLESRGRTVDFRILGTDISDEALDVAREAVYPVAMQQNTPYEALLGRYSERLPHRQVRMLPPVRSRAIFKCRQIEAGSRRHRFEAVVCDHVLQYFSVEEQYRLVDALARAVAPGGYLYVSTPSSDVIQSIPARFKLEPCARHTYHKPA